MMVMWKKVIFSVSCAALILNCPHWVIAEEAAQVVNSIDPAAVAAAQTWLAMLDQGQYEESWVTADIYFKSRISKEKWASEIAATRQPLGSFVSRSLWKTQYETKLPDFPDAEYYAFSFKTVFENNLTAIETVTVMKDADGQWRFLKYSTGNPY